MEILKKGMAVNCRTQDEIDVFKEVAAAEGHYWSGGAPISKRFEYIEYDSVGISFLVGYDNHAFPNDITWCNIEFVSYLTEKPTQVEASVLFRNRLIARRAKYERGGSK